MAELNKVYPQAWTQELAHHVIDKAEAYTLRCRYPRLMGLSARETEWGYGRLMKIYRLHTNTGYEGWGLVAPTVSEAEKWLTGKSLNQLFTPGEGIKSECRSAEFPILDLAGKILGQPVYRLLGLPVSLSLPTYDGSVFMQDLSPRERPSGMRALTDAIAQDYDAGYRTFRLSMGRGVRWCPLKEEGLLRDNAALQALHAHFPSAGFMVDFSAAEADYILAFLQGSEGIPLVWVEIPLREDREIWTALRESLAKNHPGTLLVASQSKVSPESAVRLMAEGLLDGFHPDVTSWGLSRFARLLPRVEEAGGFLSPGCYGNPLKTLYAAHLGVLSSSIHSIEGVNATLEGVTPDAFLPHLGECLVPEKPGFGADFIWGQRA